MCVCVCFITSLGPVKDIYKGTKVHKYVQTHFILLGYKSCVHSVLQAFTVYLYLILSKRSQAKQV